MRDPQGCGVTQRQQRVLDALRVLTDRLGRPPTRREMGAYLGMTINGLHSHLKVLSRKGMIEWDRRISRGVRLSAPRGIPVVGRVTPSGRVIQHGGAADGQGQPE